MFAHTEDGSEFGSAGACEQRHLTGERLARRTRDRDRHDLAGRGEAVEVDDLVVAGAAAEAARVGPRGALHEHVERAADEALRALAGAPLDDLDEPLHALHG